MTQKLKRYDRGMDEEGDFIIVERNDGYYVTYEDYQKLQEQLGRAEAALRLISAPHCDYRTFESETIERLIECIIADTDYARQYFKEKENND